MNEQIIVSDAVNSHHSLKQDIVNDTTNTTNTTNTNNNTTNTNNISTLSVNVASVSNRNLHNQYNHSDSTPVFPTTMYTAADIVDNANINVDNNNNVSNTNDIFLKPKSDIQESPSKPKVPLISTSNEYLNSLTCSNLNLNSNLNSNSNSNSITNPNPITNTNTNMPTPLSSPLTVPTPVKETHHIFFDYNPLSGNKTLNSYEIVKELGRGQHGKVKLGRDLITNEYVAIKIVLRTSRPRLGLSHANSANSQEQKIRREIAILKKCNHPNVVRLREVLDDSSSNKIYLVLEYVEKGEIKWHNDQNNPLLSEDEARNIFRQTLLGLEYLHFQGIIHRDIKPANLLLSKDNIVKISDFGVSYLGRASYEQVTNDKDNINKSKGISSRLSDEIELAKTAGTPAFFAPELCYTDTESDELPPHITGKIDIWALGVTLYCLLFGQVPFMAANEFELFNVIAKNPLTFPIDLQTGNITPPVSQSVIDLLNHMLQKHPDKRSTISQIKHDPWVLYGLSEEQKKIFLSQCGNDSLLPIQVSHKEVDEAVLGITGRIKRSLTRLGNTALQITGLRRKSSTKKTIQISEALAKNKSNNHERSVSKSHLKTSSTSETSTPIDSTQLNQLSSENLNIEFLSSPDTDSARNSPIDNKSFASSPKSPSTTRELIKKRSRSILRYGKLESHSSGNSLISAIQNHLLPHSNTTSAGSASSTTAGTINNIDPNDSTLYLNHQRHPSTESRTGSRTASRIGSRENPLHYATFTFPSNVSTNNSINRPNSPYDSNNNNNNNNIDNININPNTSFAAPPSSGSGVTQTRSRDSTYPQTSSYSIPIQNSSGNKDYNEYRSENSALSSSLSSSVTSIENADVANLSLDDYSLVRSTKPDNKLPIHDDNMNSINTDTNNNAFESPSPKTILSQQPMIYSIPNNLDQNQQKFPQLQPGNLNTIHRNIIIDKNINSVISPRLETHPGYNSTSPTAFIISQSSEFPSPESDLNKASLHLNTSLVSDQFNKYEYEGPSSYSEGLDSRSISTASRTPLRSRGSSKESMGTNSAQDIFVDGIDRERRSTTSSDTIDDDRQSRWTRILNNVNINNSNNLVSTTISTPASSINTISQGYSVNDKVEGENSDFNSKLYYEAPLSAASTLKEPRCESPKQQAIKEKVQLESQDNRLYHNSSNRNKSVSPSYFDKGDLQNFQVADAFMSTNCISDKGSQFDILSKQFDVMSGGNGNKNETDDNNTNTNNNNTNTNNNNNTNTNNNNTNTNNINKDIKENDSKIIQRTTISRHASPVSSDLRKEMVKKLRETNARESLGSLTKCVKTGNDGNDSESDSENGELVLTLNRKSSRRRTTSSQNRKIKEKETLIVSGDGNRRSLSQNEKTKGSEKDNLMLPFESNSVAGQLEVRSRSKRSNTISVGAIQR